MKYFSKKTSSAILVFIISLSVYLLFQNKGMQGYEDETYKRIVSNIENSEFKANRSGYAQITLETPFVWLGYQIDKKLGHDKNIIARLLVEFYNPFIAAVIVTTLFLTLLLFTNYTRSYLITGVFAFGTMIFPYALIGMEPTSVMSLALSIYFLFNYGKNGKNIHLFLSGLAYSSLFFSKAYYFITGLAFVYYLYSLSFEKNKFSFKKFIHQGLILASPLLIVFPLYVWGNLVSFNKYIGGQYNVAEEVFGGEHFIFGIYGLLLSFGKSFFIYNAVILLSVIFFKRFYLKYKKEAIFILIYTVFLLGFVSRTHWWSDETWGPRYLLSLAFVLIIPLVVLKKDDFKFIVGNRIKSILLTLIILFSFSFQLLGTLVRYDVFAYTFYDIYHKTGYNVLASQEYQYIPQFAPYIVNWRIINNSLGGKDKPLTYKIIYSPPMEAAGLEDGEVIKHISYDTSKYENYVADFWWKDHEYEKYSNIIAIILLTLTLGSIREVYKIIQKENE